MKIDDIKLYFTLGGALASIKFAHNQPIHGENNVLHQINKIFYYLERSKLKTTKNSLDSLKEFKERIRTIPEHSKLFASLGDELSGISLHIENVIKAELKNLMAITFPKSKLEDLDDDYMVVKFDTYFQNQKEEEIFIQNIQSLREFEILKNFKYSIIAMGSILEFFLTRYCNAKDITPLNNKGSEIKKNKATFVNYVESAIQNDIFGEKDRWKIVQDYLRDFRNYIHIEKEISSREIDENWYKTMSPVFNALLEHFENNSI